MNKYYISLNPLLHSPHDFVVFSKRVESGQGAKLQCVKTRTCDQPWHVKTHASADLRGSKNAAKNSRLSVAHLLKIALHLDHVPHCFHTNTCSLAHIFSSRWLAID